MSKNKDFYIVNVKGMEGRSQEKDRHVRNLKEVAESISGETIKSKPITYHKLARRLREPGDEAVIDTGMVIIRARFTQLEIPMGDEPTQTEGRKGKQGKTA